MQKKAFNRKALHLTSGMHKARDRIQTNFWDYTVQNLLFWGGTNPFISGSEQECYNPANLQLSTTTRGIKSSGVSSGGGGNAVTKH